MPSNEKKLQPLLLAFTLAISLAVAFGFTWMVAVGIVQDLRRDRQFETASRQEEPRHTQDRVVIGADGKPLIEVQPTGRFYMTPAAQVVRYQDLEGNLVNQGGAVPVQNSVWLDRHDRSNAWKVHWPGRNINFWVSGSPGVHWHFIHDGRVDGRAYFVGYDDETYRCVGYIGKQGSREALAGKPPREECFQVVPSGWGFYQRLVTTQWFLSNERYSGKHAPDLSQGRNLPSWLVFLSAEDGLYRVDLKSHEVSRIFEGPLLAVESLWEQRSKEEGPVSHLVLRTTEKVILLDPDGTLLGEAMIPEPLRDANHLVFHQPIGETNLLTTEGWLGRPGASERLVKVYRFDSSGEISETQEIRLEAPRVERMNSWDAAPLWLVSCPAMAIGVLLAPLESVIQGDRTFTESFKRMWEEMAENGLVDARVFFPFTLLFPLLWAGIAWRRECRFGATEGGKHLWTAFVYLGGLIALLGYLAHREWPLRERCVKCGEPSPVDHEACSHCGEHGAPPELKGIEVFG